MIGQLPDWRDIGRHIGNRLRDIINPGQYDDGPSKEEKSAKRKQDILKGFAYFDTFDEVEEWRPETTDPLQRSNTPLLQRAPQPVHAGLRAKILLCHDYKGGYVDSESARPGAQEEPYSCNYLQFVEIGCYFAHRLVSSPPPPIINCLHRHGVRVIGTFIIEPQTPDIERIFKQVGDRYIIADQLAKMSQTFGFDGWLLNMEKAFEDNRTEQLIQFISQLKLGLGQDAVVIWYDSLTVHNDVQYQNSLSWKNIRFANAADGFFTNYKWTEDKLQQSANLARENHLSLSGVYFGIDVWAQNNNMGGPPRITWPKEGGGGTNTGLAVKVLAEKGFSAAIFAPGWTHEHFDTGTGSRSLKHTLSEHHACEFRTRAPRERDQMLPKAPEKPAIIQRSSANPFDQSIRISVSESIWQGAVLPPNLDCDCRGRPHHTEQYRANPIIKSATEFPVGSASFFETDFSGASWLVYSDLSAIPKAVPCLGCQSPEPCRSATLSSVVEDADNNPIVALYKCFTSRRTGSSARRALSIRARLSADCVEDQPRVTKVPQKLRLYNLAISSCLSLVLKLIYLNMVEDDSRAKDYGLYVGLLIRPGQIEYEYFSLLGGPSGSRERCFELKQRSEGTRLVELGAFCNGSLPLHDEELFQCHFLGIVPKTAMEVQQISNFTISSLSVIERGSGPNAQKRLAWEWRGDWEAWPACLPFSSVTGPFSYFTISANGQEIGRSHSLEFPLEPHELGSPEEREEARSFVVRGICFGDLQFRGPMTASITIP